MQFQYEAWSLESRNPEVRKLFIFYFRFCLLAFWNLNTVHSLVSGDKIYDAQTLFVALILTVIKIFCLDLSPGCVCFETFDYLRMPHQRAFDPIFSVKFHFTVLWWLGGNSNESVSHSVSHSFSQSYSKLPGVRTIYVCSDLFYLVSALKVI
jgi:hypothetical protein